MNKQLLTLFLLVIITVSAIAQKTSKSIDARIFKIADSICKASKVPGIGVGYWQNGKGTFFGNGVANKKTKAPFKSNTVFEIGSITKTFTAYILQKVLTDNNIPDTAKIIHYLPDSLKSNKLLGNITFLQLLNHTSGLERVPSDLPNDTNPYSNYTTKNLFAYLKNCTITASPKYDYSNTGMALAGILAETISSKNYKKLVQDDVLKDFKVGYYKPETDKRPRAQGYMDIGKISYWDWDCMMPCGGLQLDMMQTLLYLKNIMLPVNDDQKSIVNNILTPTSFITKNLDKNENTFYWHNGGTYGFSTFCGFNKANNTAVIIVINEFNKNQFADLLGVKALMELSK
jgi:CubicO group peptidase (beta-lactamase class C family)